MGLLDGFLGSVLGGAMGGGAQGMGARGMGGQGANPLLQMALQVLAQLQKR